LASARKLSFDEQEFQLRREARANVGKGLEKFMASGIPQEIIRGASNIISSGMQAGAANPYIAVATTTIVADIGRRTGAMSKNGRNLVWALGAGYLGAKAGTELAKGIGDVIDSFVPFTPASTEIVQTAVSFDNPDSSPNLPIIIDVPQKQLGAGAPPLLPP